LQAPRVEWTVLSGELAESVLSVLIYSEHPRALRIRPSQGDGGVDILVPNDVAAAKTDVYQVKKFATNLSTSQKGQIDRSYWRLLNLIANEKIHVANWYLFMPLDPTPENQTWFADLSIRALTHYEDVLANPAKYHKEPATAEGVVRIRQWIYDPETSTEWRGLIACEALAARYPYVIDYYLHGGRDQLESAMSKLASLLRVDQDIRRTADGPDVQPADLREHLLRIQSVLDVDPHFRYGVSLDPKPPILTPDADLVAATQEIAEDGTCLTFRIYTRFAEALNERPVPIKLKFSFEAETSEFEQFELWRKYGRPVTLPAAVEIDLPGGLGGSHPGGTVSIAVSADRDSYLLRHRLVDMQGKPLATVAMTMEPSSAGTEGTGRWTRGRDSSGVIEFESFFDLTEQVLKLELQLHDPKGSVVVDALHAYEFLTHWQPGNRLEISGPQGPFRPFVEFSEETLRPVEPQALRLLAALAMVQTRIQETLLVPDVTQMTSADVRAIFDAASMADGQTIVGHWTEAPLYPMAGVKPDLDTEVQCEIVENFMLKVGDSQHVLGVSTLRLQSARVHQTEDGFILKPEQNDSAFRWLDPDTSARHSGPPLVRSRPVTQMED
jgi:hypothetical protein